MLRYNVSPKLRDQGGTICLGFSVENIHEVTHANVGRLSEAGGTTQCRSGVFA